MLHGLSLLLVEDNRDVAEMTALALGAYGADVQCAHTGAEALDRSVANRFDVAVLDLGLPDMRGVELARRLRDAEAVAHIVALTGFDEAGEDSARLFDAFLQKPVGAGDLARAIAGALAHGRAENRT